jgi:hypothetical protein
MNVVGHEDEGVELVTALGAVFVEDVQEEVRVRVGLEEAAAVRGNGGDEEGSDFLWWEGQGKRLVRNVDWGKMTLVRWLASGNRFVAIELKTM